MPPQSLEDLGTAWASEDAFGRSEDPQQPVLFIAPERDWYNCTFFYTYFSRVRGAYVITPPQVSNLKVESTPSEFLGDNAEPTLSGLGVNIRIHPNMKQLSLWRGKIVTLTISFQTQFKRETRTYMAQVR